MNSVIRFDPEACSGCWACTMACADQNDLRLGLGDLPWRLVTQIPTEREGTGCTVCRMEGCLHCEDAPCMTVCPRNCFTRLSNGLILLDTADCIRCHRCIRACKHQAIRENPDGRLSKCNGCAERVAAGLQPACERICPTKAISFQFRNSRESGQAYTYNKEDLQ